MGRLQHGFLDHQAALTMSQSSSTTRKLFAPWLRAFRCLYPVTVIASRVLFCVASSILSAAETAGELVSFCSNVITAPDVRAGKLHYDPTFENARCWGGFAAVQELSRVKNELHEPPLLGIRAPRDTTCLELIKVFVSYVRSHPESGDEPFATVVILVLSSRIPCAGTE
jgi:hypothetical protein